MTKNQLLALKPGEKVRLVSYTVPYHIYGHIYEVERVFPRVLGYGKYHTQPGIRVKSSRRMLYHDDVEKVK